MTEGRFSSIRICFWIARPPMMFTIVIWPRENLAISSRCVTICFASSRVGAMMSAMGDFDFVVVLSVSVSVERDTMCSRMGMPKARVLPDPVLALPIRSWPWRIRGMARDWIEVGDSNWRDCSARKVGCESRSFDQFGNSTSSTHHSASRLRTHSIHPRDSHRRQPSLPCWWCPSYSSAESSSMI